MTDKVLSGMGQCVAHDELETHPWGADEGPTIIERRPCQYVASNGNTLCEKHRFLYQTKLAQDREEGLIR